MWVTRLDARPGVDALSGAELRQLMSLQADKASCGSDESCLAELTGALGAPLAVFSDVGKLGALTVVNLTLFDVAKAVPVGRASVETEKLEELPAKLDAAVDALLAGQAASASTSVSAATAAKAAAADDKPTATASAARHKKQAGASPPPPPPPAPGGSMKGSSLEDAMASAAGSTGAPSAGSGDAGGAAGGLAPSAVNPGLRPIDVRNVIAKHHDDLRACADLARSKGKKGFVKVSFLIAPDGKVTFAHVAGTDLAGTGVPKCAIDKVASFTFPATGAPVTITYPLRFE